ncbi:uncharacterized protein [Anabrus simplex]
MYSTSIMRFLNHLSSIAQNADETLYSMAKKLYIPEWLVSLRHDSAHGFSLPSLELFRSAAHVALTWLHEHYWKCEAETASDWIVNEKSTRSEEGGKDSSDLAELMDSWQALKLHLLGGYVWVRDLPDVELRTYAQEILENSSKKGIKSSISILFGKLLKAIRRKYKRKHCDLSELVNIIVTRESFLPPASCINLLNDSLNIRPEKDCLPVWLLNLWKDLFTTLHNSYSLLSLVVCRLITLADDESESSHRRQMAALWVKELCQGLERGREVLKTVNEFERKKRNVIQDKVCRKQLMRTVSFKVKGKKAVERKVTRKTAWKIVKSKLENEDPGWKNALCLELDEPPGSICSDITLKKTVIKPNSNTKLFLPSLLELVVPPIPQRAKENLLSLVQIYTQSSPAGKQLSETPVHTTEELVRECGREDVTETSRQSPQHSDTEVFPSEAVSNWVRSEDDDQWATCPLGILPWQRDTVPSFDLPQDISWHPLEPTSTHTREDRSLPGLFHQKINWIESIKKRPNKRINKKARQRKLGVRCIQNAFNFVSEPKQL